MRSAAGEALIASVVASANVVLGDPVIPEEFSRSQPHQATKKRADLVPFLPPPSSVGRPREWPFRRIFEGNPHLLRGGLSLTSRAEGRLSLQ